MFELRMGAVLSEMRDYPFAAGKCATAAVLQASGGDRPGAQTVCPRPEKLHGFHSCARRRRGRF